MKALPEPIPLKKREWCYAQKPQEYEMTCDKCGGRNLDWSEYEGKIWCFDCEIDTKGTLGIFDGPIPVEVSHMLGMRFDRIDLVNNRVIREDEYMNKEKKDVR